MKYFYFRSVMLVFIMIGALAISGCSMYPAITPVVKPVIEDEHNIAKSELEGGKIQLVLNKLIGNAKKDDTLQEAGNATTQEQESSEHPELYIDFEAQPIETIVDGGIEDELAEHSNATNGENKAGVGEESSDSTQAEPIELKQIALTFDDGPDLKYTTQVLDVLLEKDIKATFFIVGIQINKYPEVVQRMVDEGHLIANHTYHHPNLKSLNKEEILHELDSTDELIESIVGFKPNIVRPPYGSINKEVRKIIEDTGRHVVLWNIVPRDWASTPVDEMYENVMINARNEGNILFHSFGGKQIQNTVDLLPKIIDSLLAESYTFVTADKLIVENE